MENFHNPTLAIGQQIQEVKIKKELDTLPGNDDGIKVEGYSPDVVPTALGAETPPDDEGFSTLLEHGEPTWTVESNRIRHAWRYFLLTPEEIDTFADEGKTPDAEARISVMHEMEIDGNEETLFLHQWEEPSSPAPQAPSIEMTTRRSRWDEKPETAHRTIDNAWEITPSAVGVLPNQSPPSKKRRTRWDQPPVETIRMNSATTDCEDASPITPGMVSTYSRNLLKATAITAVAESSPMIPGSQLSRWCHQDIKQRNRPMADEELDTIFPHSYQILIPPSDYNPTETLNHQLAITPDTDTRTGFFMQTENVKPKFEDNMMKRNLPFMKPDDTQFFGKLLIDVDEYSLTVEELKERQIMNLLLKIKNGEPPIRKIAMRHITNKAREFGAGPLFNQILPLMMNVTLEDHERHQLVKVIDRILFKLDNLVRPYVHGILIVIEPLLIDEDYYARVEGRQVISNLTKAVGFATMVTTMRPDIDSRDECVRNTTSRTFAVVACTLGIPMLLPFLRAVCKSKKSSQTRHTGFKIVQQIAILMGNAILPHLTSLVEIVESGLEDQHGNNRIMSALAVAALAEASTPYGIESFDTILRPLWLNIRKCRGKVLAGFLKAAGCLIPLMETKFASCYTREIMPIIIREFRSPDSEMKCILLKLVKQCCCTADGLDVLYIKEELLPHFFEHFWTYRIEPNQRIGRQLADTTIAIASKIGTYDILNRLVDHLKDENEKVRQMAMVTISKIMEHVGAGDIDAQLEEQLLDGILYTFQEQSNSNRTILTAFSTIVTQLGKRVKPYLPQISDIIMWRLNNKCSLKRQQSADLISYIAAVIKQCNDLKLLNYLAVVLFENLGEEYPDVLGSILGALKSILNVMAMSTVTPMLKYLLHRLLPILKNRHEKVQENCVSLVGLIAQIAPEYVSAHEWLRVCFELLELFKSHNKSVRHTAINTFGYIARAIGPNDILLMLLNSLKVQQRRYRICSSVAIAVLAETCQPFTVLPSLVNEYRVREQNVRNGVLKSLSFMFKYIGAMANDYVYAVSPLLEDALQDRDLVHRQLACNAIKHISLGVNGMGREDVLIHLMNYVWPNIFETSPHLSLAFQEAIGALRVALGPTKILQYLLQGLFHSSRKVRKAYWNIYNMVYVGAQDALVAGYPRIVNDSRNRYIRYELDYNL